MQAMQFPSRIQLYYLCQIAGWGGYGLAMSVFSYFYKSPHSISANEILANGLLCLFALLLTHYFRLIFKQYQWLSFPIPRLAAFVIGSNVIMSALYVGAAVMAGNWLGVNPEAIATEDLVLLVINYMTLFLFWSVIYFAIAFFRRYRKEEIERLQWENALKEFELNKLKSQLNPHFVFNALNGIRSLVEEDPKKSKLAITQLSNILRNSLLSDRNQTIPLSEEMKTVMDYLNLEKIRFDERLHFQLKMDEDGMDYEVPPMMIQTLVENAVKHGISKRLSGGEISISSKLSESGLEIRIDNSGILGNLSTDGHGILNTRQRLELIYNKAAVFDIRQTNAETVSAILTIPKINK
jgi:two-component system LytT family sensor kinase